MVLADHNVVRGREGETPADLNGRMELALLVHLNGDSLRAKYSISLSETTDLGVELFLIRVSSINQAILDCLLRFDSDCKRELVADTLV